MNLNQPIRNTVDLEDSVLKQVKLIYKWPDIYAQQVKFEYDRFMKLRAKNASLSPSDDIDKYWHQHILNTKSYFAYCKNLGIFIHHDPVDAFDQKAKKERLKNTLFTYEMIYGHPIYLSVWGFKAKDVFEVRIYKIRDTGIPSETRCVYDKSIYFPKDKLSNDHNNDDNVKYLIKEKTGYEVDKLSKKHINDGHIHYMTILSNERYLPPPSC